MQSSFPNTAPPLTPPPPWPPPNTAADFQVPDMFFLVIYAEVLGGRLYALVKVLLLLTCTLWNWQALSKHAPLQEGYLLSQNDRQGQVHGLYCTSGIFTWPLR